MEQGLGLPACSTGCHIFEILASLLRQGEIIAASLIPINDTELKPFPIQNLNSILTCFDSATDAPLS
jgi:hypothetical protein